MKAGPDIASLGKVLVTGASGFLGRRMMARIGQLGGTATGWSSAEVNLLDREATGRALDACRPDTIFHLAASGVAPQVRDDIGQIAADLAMADNLLAQAGAGKRLIVAGSVAEYGLSGLHDEAMACYPGTAYGLGKLTMGLHCLARSPAHGHQVTIARLFGLYGPGEAAGRLIPNLVRNLSAGDPVPLSDGLQERDFIHVDDACDALVRIAANRDAASVINVGTGIGVTVREVAELIADRLGAPRELLRFGAVPRRSTDTPAQVAATDRLREAIGFVPPHRLVPGMDPAIFSRAPVDLPAAS